MLTTENEFKRGDTFRLTGQVSERPGGVLPIDITDWTIRSQMRTADGDLLGDMVVTVTDAAAGRFNLRCDDTTAWPPGLARMDIEYTDGGGVILSTDTLNFQIIPDQTLPAPDEPP